MITCSAIGWAVTADSFKRTSSAFDIIAAAAPHPAPYRDSIASKPAAHPAGALMGLQRAGAPFGIATT